MTMSLAELLSDLTDEQAALATVLRDLPADAWDRPTHAPGWMVRDQVAHLASTDESATRAIVEPEAFLAAKSQRVGDGEDLGPSFLERGRAMSPSELLAWWQTAAHNLIVAAERVDPAARLPWFGPAMSPASFLTARLMETWSHGLDVVDVTGAERPDADRLRHVARLGVMTRPFSYRIRGLELPPDPVWVELMAPSGERWTFGEPGGSNRVRGTATDFCRVVTQRRHPADTDLIVDGDVAREWLLIAQAFAGPPGEGRRPGQFPRESGPTSPG
ncbi:MAG: TIGR03084 family metal-binding protein [Dehalococcoidia bacterium]